jgi:hypothetical protein
MDEILIGVTRNKKHIDGFVGVRTLAGHYGVPFPLIAKPRGFITRILKMSVWLKWDVYPTDIYAQFYDQIYGHPKVVDDEQIFEEHGHHLFEKFTNELFNTRPQLTLIRGGTRLIIPPA